ncbi:MAG: hypothetical protein AAF662_02715 [Pseudomonadota bacterium]
MSNQSQDKDSFPEWARVHPGNKMAKIVLALAVLGGSVEASLADSEFEYRNCERFNASAGSFDQLLFWGEKVATVGGVDFDYEIIVESRPTKAKHRIAVHYYLESESQFSGRNDSGLLGRNYDGYKDVHLLTWVKDSDRPQYPHRTTWDLRGDRQSQDPRPYRIDTDSGNDGGIFSVPDLRSLEVSFTLGEWDPSLDNNGRWNTPGDWREVTRAADLNIDYRNLADYASFCNSGMSQSERAHQDRLRNSFRTEAPDFDLLELQQHYKMIYRNDYREFDRLVRKGEGSYVVWHNFLTKYVELYAVVYPECSKSEEFVRLPYTLSVTEGTVDRRTTTKRDREYVVKKSLVSPFKEHIQGNFRPDFFFEPDMRRFIERHECDGDVLERFERGLIGLSNRETVYVDPKYVR